jgi:hypothetical protein
MRKELRKVEEKNPFCIVLTDILQCSLNILIRIRNTDLDPATHFYSTDPSESVSGSTTLPESLAFEPQEIPVMESPPKLKAPVLGGDMPSSGPL